MNEEQKTKIIAVAGKGGVGKTSIAAVMIKLLVKEFPDKRILAIDADPAVGLATALGIDSGKTVDDIRMEVVETVETGRTKAAVELLGEAKYQLCDAMMEQNGFAFIAIGRPESAGCYCKVNSYLKDVIQMLSQNFDYVVIDGEAGIEQINRRVMERVTHLVLITDTSRKGIQVASAIKDVADRLVMYDENGIIVNRIPGVEARNCVDLSDLKPLSYIMSDDQLAKFDLLGDNVFFIPEDAEIVRGVKEGLKNIGIIGE